MERKSEVLRGRRPFFRQSQLRMFTLGTVGSLELLAVLWGRFLFKANDARRILTCSISIAKKKAIPFHRLARLEANGKGREIWRTDPKVPKPNPLARFC